MNLYAFDPLKQNDRQEVLTPVSFNLILSLPEQLLKRPDKVGHELVNRYGIAGRGDKQQHHIAIVHLPERSAQTLRDNNSHLAPADDINQWEPQQLHHVHSKAILSGRSCIHRNRESTGDRACISFTGTRITISLFIPQ